MNRKIILVTFMGWQLGSLQQVLKSSHAREKRYRMENLISESQVHVKENIKDEITHRVIIIKENKKYDRTVTWFGSSQRSAMNERWGRGTRIQSIVIRALFAREMVKLNTGYCYFVFQTRRWIERKRIQAKIHLAEWGSILSVLQVTIKSSNATIYRPFCLGNCLFEWRWN